MNAERWLAVVTYEGFYEVSDFGRVRSLGRWIKSSHGYTQYYKGRVLKSQPNTGEYPCVALSKYGCVRQFSIQSLVLEAFVGPRPAGYQACHGPDPDRMNCRLTNLRWDTVSNNQKDRLTQGARDYRGSANGSAKLIEGDIHRIHDLSRSGVQQKTIGCWLGTSESNVQLILSGKAWAHVAQQAP